LEHGNLICRKLREIEAIDALEGAYEVRLFIKNHLKLEEIAKGKPQSMLDEALKKFQASKKNYSQKIEALQAEKAAKKKVLADELEKQLKEQLKKKK
jgi:hypothetical protein